MKPLLIHNDNVPFRDDFDEHIKFSSYENTLKEMHNKSFEIIYIKDTLSSNYLELYGLILAYHIRFEEKFKFLPIVILSDLDGFTLNRFEPMARILFTKNIFLEENSKKTLKKYHTKTIEPLKKEEYKTTFLDLIEVKFPENSTNHSIANEWAIDRWALFLEVESEAIRENREKISSFLYYKYLLALNPVENRISSGKSIIKKNEGKILLIDDEADKGWGDIFKKYFEDIDFIVYDKSSRDIDLNSIDIVILDLRITEEDHNRDMKIESLTGIEFAQKIKRFNAGIQIIMFTATSNSLILEELYKQDILGYIKKEHPTDTTINTIDNINKFIELVDRGLERKYLKEIWIIQNKILGLNIFQKENENFIKIKSEIETIFEILNSDLENKIKFTILTIFKVLEILTEYANLKGGEFNKIKKLFTDNDLEDDDTNISQLVCTRNFLVHSGKIEKLHPSCIKQNNLIKEPTQDNILTWFKMLQTILEKINNDQPNS